MASTTSRDSRSARSKSPSSSTARGSSRVMWCWVSRRVAPTQWLFADPQDHRAHQARSRCGLPWSPAARCDPRADPNLRETAARPHGRSRGGQGHGPHHRRRHHRERAAHPARRTHRPHRRPQLGDALPVPMAQGAGNVAEQEMYRVFNCGIGMVVVVDPEHAEQAAAMLRGRGDGASDRPASMRGRRVRPRPW